MHPEKFLRIGPEVRYVQTVYVQTVIRKFPPNCLQLPSGEVRWESKQSLYGIFTM